MRRTIFGSKMAHLLWTIFFFSKNHCYYFHVPICPFHCAKFKKFLQRIQNYEDAPFLGPKWSICPKQNFFCKIINIILIYLLTPYPELWGYTIFGPKMAYLAYFKWEFFSENVFMSLVSFIHVCLYPKNQSRILIY